MEQSPTEIDFSHASGNSFEYQVKIAGQANALTPHLPLASAGIGMRFSGTGALFFQLGRTLHERNPDQLALARELLQLAQTGKWDRDWVVITEVIRAEAAVILISESSDGSAELAVDADLAALGLQGLTAGANISLAHSSSLDTKIAGAAGLTPLFRAVRVKRRWFVGPRKVAPAYSGDAEEFIANPDPNLSEVLEELDSYPRASKEGIPGDR
jgi:hypothetical protein